MGVRLYKVKPRMTVYTPSRVMEWQNAAASFGFGIILLTNSVFATGSQWDKFEKLASEKEWGLAICLVALVRVAALLVNGHYRRTPALRAATALLGAGLWSMVAMLFVQPGEPLTTGVAVYAVLAYGDLVCAWRAAKDAAIADWIWGVAMRDSPAAPMVWTPDPASSVDPVRRDR